MLNFDPHLKQIHDYHTLFTHDIPLLDVRAPVEFTDGAFPTACNHPIINDAERHKIGLTYKQQGQNAAINLGLKLVAGKTKQDRIASWNQFALHNPHGALYCFRGGMRSKIAQQWLYESTGIQYPRIKGGYKRLRRYLIEKLEQNAHIMHPVILGGQTGVGKTRLIEKLDPHLNLEKLAWHRGSAFGRHATPQPTQINFENQLSITLLKLICRNNRYFVSEDESRNIGTRHLPLAFFTPFSQAPIVVLEADIEERIDITLQEYVHDALAEYQAIQPRDTAFEKWRDYLLGSLTRIEKRLGRQNYTTIRQALVQALKTHNDHGDIEPHRIWIELLLTNYYDRMYNYQLAQKKERILFSGKEIEVVRYLKDRFDIKEITA